eukprot:CAMPEP_0172921492 /NCGR_PEP_ID=MMETSP1075-20121228/205988_1 /TAXON_ID=2916 /ORGANISM="Ceratium fusus, Strain PA161109" /LENGTH=140 /DNA_ID=CAMNT_0013781659 /DNA_START=1286 /DNA_END=1708 /DNA_ORIENTATION=+
MTVAFLVSIFRLKMVLLLISALAILFVILFLNLFLLAFLLALTSKARRAELLLVVARSRIRAAFHPSVLAIVLYTMVTILALTVSIVVGELALDAALIIAKALPETRPFKILPSGGGGRRLDATAIFAGGNVVLVALISG